MSNSRSGFPADFFGALNLGKDEEALEHLLAEANTDGDVPSPRAQALIENGEWDKYQKLTLVCVTSGACPGRIGNDDYRFCGKPQNFCKIAAHSKSVTPVKRGWYIAVGKQQGGLFTKPFLPTEEDGGPIKARGAARLLDGDNPFRLSKGQWIFVIDSWYAAQVDDPVDNFDEYATTPEKNEPPALSIDTTLPHPIVLPEESEAKISLSATGDNELTTTVDDHNGTTTGMTPEGFLQVKESAKTTQRMLAVHKANLREANLTMMRLEARFEAVTAKCEEQATQLQELTQRNNAMLVRNQNLENRVVGLQRTIDEKCTADSVTFRNISTRIALVETGSTQGLAGNGTTFHNDYIDKIEALDKAVLGADGTLSKLKKQFYDFKEAAESGGAMDCHGVTFRSKGDFLEWFDETNPSIEIFLDAVAYLHAIKAPVVHIDEASRQRESQIKTEMRSSLEVAVITSFDTVIPSVLVGGKRQTEALGGTYSWLISYLKTFAVWKPVGSSNGVSDQIKTGIPRVTGRVNDLRRVQTIDQQALLLSSGLCHDSAHFCNELVQFISEQQEELTTKTIYTDNQVWEMQVECLQKIIEELSEARGTVSDAARFQPALYIWGMYKAWIVQQRYLENHFKNDPALTGIMVRRILMQGQDVSVKKQLDKIDNIERKVDEHNRQHVAEFKKLKEQVSIISSDGWVWVLAWAQVGVSEIQCAPTTEKARSQLKEMCTLAPFRRSLKEMDAIKLNEAYRIQIICIHTSLSSNFNLCSIADLLSRLAGTTMEWILFVSCVGPPRYVAEVQRAGGSLFSWTHLRHTAMGGLTTARMVMGVATNIPRGKTSSPSYPRRPLNRFLDPIARHAAWRKATPNANDCWYPHRAEAKPYAWPWKTGPQWVETPSVLLGGTIHRHLTDKEKCQLLDMRTDWVDLLPSVQDWDDGMTPPLRLCVETIVLMRRSLWKQEQVETGTKGNRPKQMELKEEKDWGRKRPPIGNKELDIAKLEQVLYFGWFWDPDDTLDISTATKGDDAEVNLQLWAVGGGGDDLEKARATLRQFLLQIWRKKTCREARAWLRRRSISGSEYVHDRDAVADSVWRIADSTWWNWDVGSRLFFWRWPTLWQSEAKSGGLGFHTKFPRPQLKFPQIPIEEQWVVDKDKEKLEKLIRRKYIVPGFCKTTVPRFPVPKGTDDIRVVWDLAKNGLNETMYTPTFFLATMHTYIRRISAGFYGGDFDVGEQFHNYPLHEAEQIYCGVEIPTDMVERLTAEGIEVHPFMRWARLVFGWQSSPYMALRMFARVLELAKGKPTEAHSAFRWDRVDLNLPGSATYDPGQPRVIKRRKEGSIACDIVSFYDDGRVFGPSEDQAHQALRQITSKIQYYGNQDAARKRRPVSQRPGAWAGGVAYTDNGILRVFVSQSKWDKAKEFLNWVRESLTEHKPLERKRFQSGKGFLVHMSLCYEFMLPYMKGFHLSEDAWRRNRDPEGWKVKEETDVIDNDPCQNSFPDLDGMPRNDMNAPPLIEPVPRLDEDVRILQLFFNPPTPVQIISRPVGEANLVVYGGGDASGEGFGGQLQPIGQQAVLRRGFWCAEDSGESSNWRELRNLVDTLKMESIEGKLAGREIWLATDNSTAANAYYRGTSKSRLLHEMITELRMLTVEGNFTLHIYHIAGTRMIASGIDALSRGELHVSSLEDTVSTIMPLHLTAIERSPSLMDWLQAWLDKDFMVTKPSDWFYAAQQSGDTDEATTPKTWVWDLPPAAAIHAIEELGTGRLKRHDILRGVVLIPHLLSNEWFRRFSRIVDFYFFIPAGSIPEWTSEMHESLTIGIYLPLCRQAPWDWKRVPFVVPFGSSMSTMYKAGDSKAGDLLREFWKSSTGVATMPKRMVCDLLQNPSWRRFLSVSPHAAF